MGDYLESINRFPSAKIEGSFVCTRCEREIDSVVACHRGNDIIAFHDEHYARFLPKPDYERYFSEALGDEIAEAPKIRGSKYAIKESVRARTLDRDGYCCVYCQYDDEYARQSHTTQGIINEELTIFSPDEIRQMVNENDGVPVLRPQDLEIPLQPQQLQADHLVPVSIQEAVGNQLSAPQRDRAQKQWIVAACRACNNGRKYVAPNVGRLLSIYARRLMARSGSPDFDDAAEFLATLSVINGWLVKRASEAPASVSHAFDQ